MKCSNCGNELSEDSKFCSYCGEKFIENNTEIKEDKPNYTDEFKKIETEHLKEQNKISNKIKEKLKEFWNKLSMFEKVIAISIAIVSLFCLIAFGTNKVFAGVIALLQIALLVVSLLIKKQVIKTSKSWMYILVIIIAIVLIIPYSNILSIDMGNAKKFEWSDIVINDVIPQPKSNMGEIYSNSSDRLSIYVYGIKEKQYDEYVRACKEKGFNIDIEQLGGTFTAYNETGYKIHLYYYESDNKLSIEVDAPVKLGELKWSESEMAKLIPQPTSTKGNIEKDDETGFRAIIGETTQQQFLDYVTKVSNNGFNVDVSKTDKYFSAKNSNGYKVTIEYKGNNIIHINIYEQEFNVELEVQCVENLIFSKYDVEVYIDDKFEGTLIHGATENYSMMLKKGSHTIKFISKEDSEDTGEIKFDISKNDKLKFKISCTSYEISVENLSETSETEKVENTASNEIINTNEITNNEVEVSENKEGTENEKVEKKPEPVSYSNNDYETAKKGNTGVYSYVKTGNNYDIYYIIDFDEKYVYYFLEGEDNNWCDKLKIKSGDLNSTLLYTYHDGSDVWDEALYFKYKNQPSILMMEDGNHFQHQFSTTNLKEAIKLRDSKTIKEK